MKLHEYTKKIFRFQGWTKNRKVECERLKCWVGERRYYYGFVRTVIETTNVVSLRYTEITNSPFDKVNFLMKKDFRYELAKKSKDYDEEQLTDNRVLTKAVKPNLIDELSRELDIPKLDILCYVEQCVKEHRRRGHIMIDQKMAIKGYVERCSRSRYYNHWQFKRSKLARTEAMKKYG